MRALFNHRLPAALAGALAACLAGGAVLASGAVGGGATVARSATNFAINCSKGQKISKTLATAAGASKVSITFSGVCREKVVIARDNVTLRGANSESSIQLPVAPASSTSLRIVDARGIVLQQVQIDGGGTGIQIVNSSVAATGVRITDAARGLSVESGSVVTFDSGLTGVATDGVDVYDGAVFTSNHSSFMNSGGDGIQVMGGAAKLSNCKITGSGYMGVQVQSGGHAFFDECAVTHDNYVGIDASWGASAEIHGGTISFNNVGVNAASGDVLLVGTTVSSNTDAGVTGITGGRVTFGPGTVIASNGGNGLWLRNGAVGLIAGSVTFHANGQDGINIEDNSSIRLDGGDNTFTGNGDWGIYCAPSPASPLVDGRVADMGTVGGNGTGGATCAFTK